MMTIVMMSKLALKPIHMHKAQDCGDIDLHEAIRGLLKPIAPSQIHEDLCIMYTSCSYMPSTHAKAMRSRT